MTFSANPGAANREAAGQGVALYKGELVSEIPLPINSPALLYGWGVFTTMRWERGIGPLLFERHLARLAASAVALKLSWVPDQAAISSGIEALLAEHKLGDRTVVRITLLAENREGLAAELITVRPFSHDPFPIKRGWHIRIEKAPRVGDLKRHKTLNYLDSLFAWREAEEAGADETLFLNATGNLTEGSRTNIFLIRGVSLITPPAQYALLCGVARALVLEIAASYGFEAREESITPDDLAAADEALLTNAVLGVIPINHPSLSLKCPGPSTLKLQAAWETAAKKQVLT